MHYILDITKEEKLIFSLRVPFTGLTIGSNEKGDALIPMEGENFFISFVPAGPRLFFTVKEGKELTVDNSLATSGELQVGSKAACNGYFFEVRSDDSSNYKNSFGSKPNGTMKFHAGTGVLETISGAIIVTSGADAGKAIALNNELTTIGTDLACDLVLTDQYVSSRHCILSFLPHGLMLRDLGSTNGIIIGDTSVSEATLQDKNEFQIGETKIRLEIAASVDEVVPIPGNQYCHMVGKSDQMRKIFNLLEKVSATFATVLFEGETGTGKELAARAVHIRSRRAAGPFIALNCGAISLELVESELFGHVKGAFSGALVDRKGVFELANGGTLFLDEISELPLSMQTKLLRALETLSIRKVGGENEIVVDVRIVAATNKSLIEQMEKGEFRKDLYYRLAMIQVKMPSLLERQEDIPLLVEHFLRRESKTLSIFPVPKFGNEAHKILDKHHWPGNIRELVNVIRRSLIVSDPKPLLEEEDILLDKSIKKEKSNSTLDKIEKAAIEQAIKSSTTRTEAAKILGIAHSTLYVKMKKHGIE